MNEAETCYVCSGDALLVQAPRRVKVGRRKVDIIDDFMQCRECGEEYYLPGQMEESQRRAAVVLAARSASLSPAQIRSIRDELGITQAEGERLVGAGPKTWVRWERGTVSPNSLTVLVLRMLRDLPGAREYVAQANSVVLPAAPTPERSNWVPADEDWMAEWTDVAIRAIVVASATGHLAETSMAEMQSRVAIVTPQFSYPDVTGDRSSVVRAIFTQVVEPSGAEVAHA